VTLTPSVVWRITPDLVRAVDAELGPPIDSYVNGSQTWLTDDGPGDITLEWRLHPPSGYEVPGGLTHYDVWDAAVSALANGDEADALGLGSDRRSLDSLWEGLECFPAYGDEVEPAVLAGAAREAVGIAPDAAGLVDHDRIGSVWERTPGEVSMVGMLLTELERG
jgi:hypothetical protein